MQSNYQDTEEFMDDFILNLEKELKIKTNSEKTKKLITKYVQKFGEIKWEQACKLQIEKCSDKVYDLMNNHDDVEEWPNEISKLETIEYDEDFELEF